MVNINKSSAPQSLSQYKREAVSQYGAELIADNIYDDFRDKSELRTSLAQEQGYICAYCMGRITDDTLKTKIEHCHSQDEFPSEKLDYGNLLLCCKGNEGRRPSDQHCDTKKGGKSFSFNPSVSQYNMSRLIKYRSDGSIYSDNVTLNGEINDILNLNYPRLRMNRKSVIKAVEEVLCLNPGQRSLGEIQKLIGKYSTKNRDGEFREYYGVAVYKLQKHHSLCSR